MGHKSPHPGYPRRNAFTLLEALAASAVLALVVLAVGAAVSSGQITTMKGTSAILASMAADDLMNELVALPYDDLVAYNGYSQPAGSLVSLQGTPYPPTYHNISRRAETFEHIVQDVDTGVRMRGTTIRVTVTADGRTALVVQTFVAEPPFS
ncbi:MAG: hypothetical protein ACYTF7_07800 [Planctomycetota bacterium]|jgi:hypothetical protein